MPGDNLHSGAIRVEYHGPGGLLAVDVVVGGAVVALRQLASRWPDADVRGLLGVAVALDGGGGDGALGWRVPVSVDGSRGTHFALIVRDGPTEAERDVARARVRAALAEAQRLDDLLVILEAPLAGALRLSDLHELPVFGDAPCERGHRGVISWDADRVLVLLRPDGFALLPLGRFLAQRASGELS